MEERWAWAGAVAALMAPLGAALANWWNRKGAKEQREGDWRERGQQTLFNQQGTQLQGAYQRVKALEAEVARIEGDRDRGWDLARAWNIRAHDERHAHVNTIQAVVSRKLTADEVLERRPDDLPGLHKLIPDGDKADPQP